MQPSRPSTFDKILWTRYRSQPPFWRRWTTSTADRPLLPWRSMLRREPVRQEPPPSFEYNDPRTNIGYVGVGGQNSTIGGPWVQGRVSGNVLGHLGGVGGNLFTLYFFLQICQNCPPRQTNFRHSEPIGFCWTGGGERASRLKDWNCRSHLGRRGGRRTHTRQKDYTEVLRAPHLLGKSWDSYLLVHRRTWRSVLPFALALSVLPICILSPPFWLIGCHTEKKETEKF